MSTMKKRINLSFSGCGFLGVYHVGVVSAFREHAPEILQNKMAGCSAGALVAACAMCNCCLGEMCSDALEIAVRARSRPFGPLYPTFAIVNIILNGLRRILPPNAHEICSGRLHISLTHWRDKRNVIVNQFHTREELIQALICSSFVPVWSGLIPPKFRGEYHWDGGLTNNNPILDEHTILISPFAGAHDICPRGESGSFYSVDFSGTDVSCTHENFIRLKQALFPPKLSVLKLICLHGYNDGLKFLKSRNMIQSSSFLPRTSISSVLGTNYTEPAAEEENELANGGIAQGIDRVYEEVNYKSDGEETDSDESAYQSDEESNEEVSKMVYSPYCEKVMRKKDLPTPLFAVFSAAREQEEDPIRQYFTESRPYKLMSWMCLPITLSFDVTCSIVTKVYNSLRSSIDTSKPCSSNLSSHVFYTLFGGADESKSSYHVHDCECTESRGSSVAGESCRTHRRPQTRNRSQKRRRQRSNRSFCQESHSAPMSLAASTSSRSEPPSGDDDDTMTINGQNENRNIHSKKTSSLVDSYSTYLQTMSDLSDQMQLN